MALQTVVSRSVDSTETAVVTVGTFTAGTATNVIAESAKMTLSVRSFSPQVRAVIKQRIHTIVDAQAATWGATATIDYESGHPVVFNAAEETEFATIVARELTGQDSVLDCALIPGSEDFAHFLDHKPGCFIRLGNGEKSAALHNPNYDFDDASLTTGAALWARIAERFLT